jgi:DNA repair exonuclease SbcCD nuclease subunit
MSKIHFRGEKICCISDIHLGIKQNSSSWHKILIDWARWLDLELIKNNIHDIMICGDFFHDRDNIAVNSMHVATDVLDILSKYNIVMITGNHDCFYKDTSLVNSLSVFKGWNNITIIDKYCQATIHNKVVSFAPWGTSINDIGDCDLVFGHFEFSNFKMNNFKVCDNGTDPVNILNKSKKIITGHFHLREHRKYQNGEVLYLGNPFQMDFGDAGGRKGWYELNFNDLSTEFHENLLSPTHIRLPLSELVKYDGITPKLKSIIHNNIIKLVIDKNIQSDDLDIIVTALNSLKPFIVNVDYDMNYNKFSVEDDLKYQYTGVDYETAITEFVNMLDINNKSDVINYTIDLYNICKK